MVFPPNIILSYKRYQAFADSCTTGKDVACAAASPNAVLLGGAMSQCNTGDRPRRGPPEGRRRGAGPARLPRRRPPPAPRRRRRGGGRDHQPARRRVRRPGRLVSRRATSTRSWLPRASRGRRSRPPPRCALRPGPRACARAGLRRRPGGAWSPCCGDADWAATAPAGADWGRVVGLGTAQRMAGSDFRQQIDKPDCNRLQQIATDCNRLQQIQVATGRHGAADGRLQEVPPSTQILCPSRLCSSECIEINGLFLVIRLSHPPRPCPFLSSTVSMQTLYEYALFHLFHPSRSSSLSPPGSAEGGRGRGSLSDPLSRYRPPAQSSSRRYIYKKKLKKGTSFINHLKEGTLRALGLPTPRAAGIELAIKQWPERSHNRSATASLYLR
jgi:hypothetical protein